MDGTRAPNDQPANDTDQPRQSTGGQPAPAAPVPPTPKTPPARIGTWLDKWVFWRALTFGFWYWLLGAILHKALGVDVLPSPAWAWAFPLVTVVYLAGR